MIKWLRGGSAGRAPIGSTACQVTIFALAVSVRKPRAVGRRRGERCWRERSVVVWPVGPLAAVSVLGHDAGHGRDRVGVGGRDRSVRAHGWPVSSADAPFATLVSVSKGPARPARSTGRLESTAGIVDRADVFVAHFGSGSGSGVRACTCYSSAHPRGWLAALPLS